MNELIVEFKEKEKVVRKIKLNKSDVKGVSLVKQMIKIRVEGGEPILITFENPLDLSDDDLMFIVNDIKNKETSTEIVALCEKINNGAYSLICISDENYVCLQVASDVKDNFFKGFIHATNKMEFNVLTDITDSKKIVGVDVRAGKYNIFEKHVSDNEKHLFITTDDFCLDYGYSIYAIHHNTSNHLEVLEVAGLMDNKEVEKLLLSKVGDCNIDFYLKEENEKVIGIKIIIKKQYWQNVNTVV